MAETVLAGLAEWSIRALLVMATAGLLLALLRVKQARLRLVVWTAVLAVVLLIPLVSAVAPPVSLRVLPLKAADQMVSPPLPAASLPVVAESRQSAGAPSGTSWVQWAMWVWVAGGCVLLARLLAGTWGMRRLVRASRALEPGVRESDAIDVPLTVGVLRPVVLLPAASGTWDSEERRAVLAHERAHARRRDPALLLAANVYAAVCWFHPLAWWLRAHLAGLAEAASDDEALTGMADSCRYAEILLGWIAKAPRRVRWEALAMARGGGMKRVERILSMERVLAGPLPRGVLAAVILAAGGLLYPLASARLVPALAAATPPDAARQQAARKLAEAIARPDLRKWVDEDVAYIITPEERQVFLHLTEHAHMVQFIEQFWLRRDPTPGTPENEAKEEHYRRIAYANERFGTAKQPGWRTDRGRTYIQMGPPDEIVADRSAPFERWTYFKTNPAGETRVLMFTGDDYRLQ
jgi:GWxTD domain-containing protein